MRKQPESPYDVTFSFAGSMSLMKYKKEGKTVSKSIEYRDQDAQAQNALDLGLTVGCAVYSYDEKIQRQALSGYRDYYS